MPADELFIDLKAAIDSRDEDHAEKVLALLRKRDEERGSCTLNTEHGNLLLRNAIQKHRRIAELLLDYGVPVNRRINEPYSSPLHLAVKENDLPMVEKLLNKGALIRATNSCGKSELYLAVELGYEKIVEVLLKKYDNPVMKFTAKYIPINLAAEIGNEKIFNLLVKSGAKSNLKYCDGTSMLHVAVEKGYEETVRKIIHQKQYDIADCKNNNLLTAAVMNTNRCIIPKKKCTNIVKMLTDAGFPIDPNNITNRRFVHTAAENGFGIIIDSLIKLGLDPNIRSSMKQPLLITACSNKHIDIVKTLIVNNADLTVEHKLSKQTVLFYTINNLHASNDNTYLFRLKSYITTDGPEIFVDDKNTCCSNEWFEIIKILVDFGIDVNKADIKMMTPLHCVARDNYRNELYHYIEVLTKLLIKAGADLNARNDDGNSPLQYAIIKGRLEMVKLLLPSTTIDNNHHLNYRKQTLLHSAVTSKSPGIIELLLKPEEFKNVDIKDANGNTPLSLAVQNNRVKAVELLLQQGANVNTVNKRMMTPLHYATDNSYGSIFKILLEHKANVNCINVKDKTPLFMALRRNDDFAVDYLLKHGADIDLCGVSGKTILHLLAECEKELDLNILNYGSNINILTNDKKTVLDLLEKSMIARCKFCDINIDPSNPNVEPFTVANLTRKFRNNAKIFINHILQLQAIDSFVCDENLHAVYYFEDKYSWINHFESDEKYKIPQIDEVRKMCQKEVELMKTTTFDNTNVNIYQILTKCPHRVAKHVLENINVIQQLQTPACIEKFPIYRKMLNYRIEKCLERKEILEQDTNYSFHQIFPSLPSQCIDEILRYLNNYNLKVLISTCEMNMNFQDSQSNANVPTKVVPSHVAKKRRKNNPSFQQKNYLSTIFKRPVSSELL